MGYSDLTLEMLDDFINELSDHEKMDIWTGKKGVIDFHRKHLYTILSKAEIELYLKKLEEELREGLYHYDGLIFEYQGRVNK